MRQTLFVFLLLIAFGAKAQTLFEKIGGIPTKFEVKSGSVDFGVQEQFLHKKTSSDYNGNAKAYSTTELLTFQIISKDKIVTRRWSELKPIMVKRSLLEYYYRGYYVRLMDKNDAVLYEFSTRGYSHFGDEFNKGAAGFYTYSIPLEGFPLILLNRVKKFDVFLIR